MSTIKKEVEPTNECNSGANADKLPDGNTVDNDDSINLDITEEEKLMTEERKLTAEEEDEEEEDEEEEEQEEVCLKNENWGWGGGKGSFRRKYNFGVFIFILIFRKDVIKRQRKVS